MLYLYVAKAKLWVGGWDNNRSRRVRSVPLSTPLTGVLRALSYSDLPT
jgi:hypothetical protein